MALLPTGVLLLALLICSPLGGISASGRLPLASETQEDSPPTPDASTTTGSADDNASAGPDTIAGGAAKPAIAAELKGSMQSTRKVSTFTPPYTAKQYASHYFRELHNHLTCAEWAVVVLIPTSRDVQTVSAQRGYSFWNDASGQLLMSFENICDNIETGGHGIESGHQLRVVPVTDTYVLHMGTFWRKKGVRPALDADSVAKLIVAASERCQPIDNLDDYATCAFDKLAVDDSSPLAGVLVALPPLTRTYAVRETGEGLGLVTVPVKLTARSTKRVGDALIWAISA